MEPLSKSIHNFRSREPPPDVRVNQSSVSLEPQHLSLNLSIQEFIESLRTIPLSRTRPLSPTELGAKLSDLSNSPKPSADPAEMLRRAQNLSVLVSELSVPDDQAIYMSELQSVSALMAYHVPEASPVAKYMSMEKREALAEQINRAILCK